MHWTTKVGSFLLLLSPSPWLPQIVFTVARNHVNRLCLAAGVTLIESGSAGYLGQVTVIRKVTIHHVHLTS